MKMRLLISIPVESDDATPAEMIQAVKEMLEGEDWRRGPIAIYTDEIGNELKEVFISEIGQIRVTEE